MCCAAPTSEPYGQISERPQIVEKKLRIGDWEADTIIGAKNQGVILSVVDRHSKFVVLQLLNGKYMGGVVGAFKKRLFGLPAHTITFDNGKEFAGHEKIGKFLELLNTTFCRHYGVFCL